MCKVIQLLLLLFSPFLSTGQITVSQQVFASSGSAGITHSGTLGEPVIFGGKDNLLVCQGFQTGLYYFLTDVSDIINHKINWEFYPVPATAGINLSWSEHGVSLAELTDISGKKIKSWYFQKNESSAFLDLTEIPSGQYVLSALGNNKEILKSSRLLIQK